MENVAIEINAEKAAATRHADNFGKTSAMRHKCSEY